MDQEVKTFENEGFSAEAIEQPGCVLSVKVVVKPKSSQKAYNKATKTVNKQISIPGFRKGHAPDRTVISRYSSYVEQEWKEILVNDAYRAALELTTIYPLNNDSIQKPKIEKCSLEEGAVVQISYEHYPHVPTIEFSQLSLPSIQKEEVAEEKVEEILEEVRRANADFEQVTGRAIEEGDYADVSIDAIDQDPPKNIVKDRRFEASDKRLAPWLKNLLIGLQSGESAEGMSEVDLAADAEVKKNFKPTQVRVTVHAIKKILLPEVDDALAAKAGASSIDDLRGKIRQNLEKEANDERQRKRIEALEDALLDAYHFDLPASIVRSEREERITKRIQALKSENISDEEIQAREKEIQQEISDEIDKAFRLYFLNKQIAKQGSLTLSNQELNDEIVRYMSQNPYLYGKEKEEALSRDLVSRMATLLMQRKAKEYALSQVE